MVRRFVCCVMVVAASWVGIAQGSDGNFPDRKALIANSSPHVELSEFGFENTSSDGRDRFEMFLAWTNRASQPLIAFEIGLLKFDPFDQRLPGVLWTVTGVNSVYWQPLAVGQKNRDGLISPGQEKVFTAIAYVRSVRLGDGTVWRVSDAKLLEELRRVAPNLKDFGGIKADAK